MNNRNESARELTFEGAINIRDLGGIAVSESKNTKMNFLLRADSIETFTNDDWEKLTEYGVRKIIDLRFKREIKGDTSPRPKSIETINISLDSGDDPDFWKYWQAEGKWATPLYYKAHLQRFPHLTASILTEIAQVKSGVVLFHCASGRDRTGLISLVLLHLAGVSSKEIAEDHSLSHDNLSKLYASRGVSDERIYIEKLLKAEAKSTQDVFDDIFNSLDVEQLLLKNGLKANDLKELKDRLS